MALAAKGVEFVILIGWAVLVPIPAVVVVGTAVDEELESSLLGLVVRVRGSATVVDVVWLFEMWAEVVREVTAPVVGLDLAWKVGLVRARKAEKKLAKKGR